MINCLECGELLLTIREEVREICETCNGNPFTIQEFNIEDEGHDNDDVFGDIQDYDDGYDW